MLDRLDEAALDSANAPAAEPSRSCRACEVRGQIADHFVDQHHLGGGSGSCLGEVGREQTSIARGAAVVAMEERSADPRDRGGFA